MPFAVNEFRYAKKPKPYLAVHLPICNMTPAANYTSMFKLL